ncbi:response regulator [Fulvivirga sedimenti]|uniref:Response regulator n=1 Tax=Fulvivirga sedimenti TaxID=2879465 RepID=A0A9X1HKJ1_9BACT|nr:response regulator [Fulvivirga sedimenti]MCA6073551.1 response regulator [Fulvivirga sedimenti]
MNTCAECVMLVDDSEIDIFINRKILEFNHFSRDIVSTTSPREALDMLSDSEISKIPEVIFLDLNMPVIDGFRFLYEFSELPEQIRKYISIVVLTSSDNDLDKELANQSSSVIKFISKPLTDEKVLAIRDMIIRAS